jgi:1-aminocyclopropane-1-carboxylate deaminase
MKYNLAAAAQQDHHTLLTFGGAYSNHIYATAAAGKRLGFHTIGIIRGEAHDQLNATLQFASNCGMQLDYADRSSYRNKTDADYISLLQKKYGRFYLLPEGGSNSLALKGCAEIMTDMAGEANGDFDYVCCACGTGATLAGIISTLNELQQAIGFPALKGGDFLTGEILQLMQQADLTTSAQWQLNTDYHFGGYARTTAELRAFITQFRKDFDVPLDGVYTGKMFFGLFDLIKKGYFPKGSRIVAIHTGGLQGNSGFNYNVAESPV